MLFANTIISILSQIIPFASGLFVFRFLSGEMKVLLVYFGLGLFVEVISSYLGLNNIHNLWLFHFFTIIEYGLLMWVFSAWLKSQTLKRILRISIPLLSLVGIIAMFFLEGIHQFNAYSRSVASLILVAASAFILFELSMESFNSVLRQPRFWIASAALLYFAGSLVLFALSNVLLVLLKWDIERVRTVFAVYTIINMITNLIYAGGFLCQVQAQRSGGPSLLEPSPS